MRNRIKRVSEDVARTHRPADRLDPKAQRLLEAAGHVFAEKGFDRATAKEICAHAGVNAAAVNYYFGGFENLYVAVVAEAHSRLVDFENIAATVARATDPKDKLRLLLRSLVGLLLGPAATSWAPRVISREFLSPSRAAETVRRRRIAQRAQVLTEIVSALMELPKDSAAVALGCITVMAPCVMLLVADRHSLNRTFPNWQLRPEAADVLVDHLVDFAVAGLMATGRNKGRATSSRKLP